MAYCKHCGAAMNDDDRFCSECGKSQDAAQVSTETTTPTTRSQDTGSFGWAVLGFLFPLAGLILWIVWKDGEPKNAHRAGMGALVGVIFTVAFTIIVTALIMALSFNTENLAFLMYR